MGIIYSQFIHGKLAESMQGSVMLTLQRGAEREKEIAQSSAYFARDKSFDDMVKEIPFSMRICNAERS